MSNIIFRTYCSTDHQACTDIFDTNCPEFFTPNERQEYQRLLEDASEGYDVCEVDQRVLSVFGLLVDGKNKKRLNWILIDPKSQGEKNWGHSDFVEKIGDILILSRMPIK